MIEPQPVHSDDLDLFVSSTEQSVIAIKKAVGAKVGHTNFDISKPFGGALASKERENTIKVEQTTIDHCLTEAKFSGPYLIKLDTHGFEKSILSGALDTLTNTNVLIIESYNYRITEEAFLFWELCEFMSNRGFRPIDIVDVLHRPYDNSLWQFDIFFIKSDWTGFNYVKYE